MDNFIPKHFATHVIQTLQLDRLSRVAKGAPSQPILIWMESVLPKAVHFILPDGGRLLQDGLRGIDSENRLPYPVVSLEYTLSESEIARLELELQEDEDVCPKRFVLVVDFQQFTDGIAALACNEWKLVKNIYAGIGVFGWGYYPRFEQWVPTMCGTWFDPQKITSTDQWSKQQIAEAQKRDYVYKKTGETKPLERFYGDLQHLVVLPEAVKQLTAMHGETEAKRLLRREMHDEFLTCAEFMEAMSCSNVLPAPIPAPEALNKKRAKNGKLPFFEYKVLTLDVPLESRESNDLGGTHASPRVHLRRGHIRRYSTYKKWINSMVVGNKKKGLITKDYELVTQ